MPVLSAWQVSIIRYPALGEVIYTATLPYQLKGIFGLRCFTMETEEGERLAWANSTWVNVNTRTGMPERLTEVDTRGYVLDEPLAYPFAPRKIALPSVAAGWEALPPFEIQRHHLDTHRHVNNCQYVRMAQDILAQDVPVRELRVEYKHQALLGDTFYPFLNHQDGKAYIVFNKEETETPSDAYAVIEICQVS